jgi:hypothetical protein
LLQVPKYRDKYLQTIGEIAKRDLDWKNLGATVLNVRKNIEPMVLIDTRKMSTNEEFLASTSDASSLGGPGGGHGVSIKAFADARRQYLLSHPAVKEAMQRATPANDNR